ncbi:methyltransferase domain-containing protein [Streptomyces sp. ID05-26A]|nr:methyltransferase domain-containing protein [Streptomyces sp. ID05-26A]
MTSQTDAVGGKYDQFAQAGTTEALGGNIHAGYWDSGTEHVPMAAATDRLTDLVAERLALRPGDRVLDVGCGNGFPAVRIAEAHGAHVTGITVSQQEVDRATELAAGSDRVVFRLADAASLPDDLGTFDAVFAIESLLHLPDQAAALARLRRFVRPGGRLVVADLCQREPFTGAGEAVLAGMVRTLEIAGINSEQEHRAGLEKAGWDLLELLDIGENVRPSYARAAEAFRRIADTAPPFAAADIITAAELMAAFGENPSSGYVLITAQRP